VSETAEGLAFFAISEQFGFDYLVGQPVLEDQLISDVGPATISLWRSNIKSTCNFLSQQLTQVQTKLSQNEIAGDQSVKMFKVSPDN